MSAAQGQIATLNALPEKGISNRARFWRSFRRSRTAMIGLVIVGLMTTGALLADVIAPFDPIEPHYTDRLVAPSATYPLGTDELGRDIFSRLLYGARISLVIGLVAQGVSVSIGVVMGLLAGWYGGWVDDVISRFMEIVWAIPGLMFLIVVVTIFDPSPLTIFAALGVIAWPGQARLMRGQVLALRDMEYVIAARAMGAGTLRLMFQHVLPNAIAPIIVVATLGVAGAILTESTLSFLGLGVKIPNPSWGTMIEIGRNYTTTAWWYAIFPGLAIMITVLGFNFIGDGLRDALDPTQYD